jgi:TonB-dependent SusC/RagA subfamily outer membrane receptor
MCALLALAVCRVAVAQVPVAGTVTSSVTGAHIQGVTVRIRGTNTTTTTDADGKYSITAPTDAVLVFNSIGYRGVGQALNGRTTIDVVLEPSVAVLPEVVVTGYMEEQRRNATGALTAVDPQSLTRQTGASALQALDGRAAGVTIADGGSPGSRTTVRIRGITSFQNNDPLYVIDGTPVAEESYLNFLNPDDIASVEVLKDASAASIYGSRASNGVVIIETKRGRPGRRQVTLDVTSGVATPVKGYDGILLTNSLDYFQVVKTAYQTAGLAVPINMAA